ncbi:MAG: hypothetical protein QUS09_03655, partial [Methanotrichaceae archaeon]|nr:hypothetical protein [Methanotrichaceae archaeon]
SEMCIRDRSKHPEGLTREEVADALKITGNRVSQLANGEKGKGGLTQKLPGFSIAEITDSIRIDDDQRRAIKRTVYKLSRYDPLSGFGAVVRLLPKTCSAKGGKPGKEPVRIPVRNAQSKETSNGERENREIEIGSKDSKEKVREGHGQSGKQEKISISLQNGEKSLPPKEPITGGHKAILTGSLTNPYRPYSKAEHIESPSLPDEQKPSNGDFSETKGGDAVKRPYCYLAKLRTLALMEYGMNGWVNPAKIAPKCGLLECQACRGLLHLGYIQYTRPDGSIAFRQRRSDELAPVRAQA